MKDCIPVTVMAVAMAAAGCQDNSESAREQVWTTKSESVLGRSTRMPALNLGEPVSSTASAGELRDPAVALLLQAAESDHPLLRANALEALQHAPVEGEAAMQRALGDENRGVRFVAAMSVGKLRRTSLAPLVAPLLHDESQSVQAAAIYALRRCGQRADLNPLAAMLVGDDPEAKGNAAFVLGELGDRTALPMLRHAVGRGLRHVTPARRKVVELQLAEAMVKLGAANQTDVIRAALFAQAEEQELAVLACQMCGELRDGQALADLMNMVRRSGRFERPPEVRMAAALAIAQIERSSIALDVPLQYVAEPQAELRAQAALTLGAILALARSPNDQELSAVTHVARLMNDEDPVVQVAAAGGAVRMTSGTAAGQRLSAR